MRRVRRHRNPAPIVNPHGAWFIVGYKGNTSGTEAWSAGAGYFATVNGAADAILKMNPEVIPGSTWWPSFKDMLDSLTNEKPGMIDCYHNSWPIVWFDYWRDECQNEIEDYEAWEEGMKFRGLQT